MKNTVALVLCWIFFSTVAGFSWGREGHRIVARIAAKNLSSVARNKIALILGTNDTGVEAAMAAASTWPDDISKSATKTGNWHFVDVPVSSPFSIGTLCAMHDCVIDRIEEMSDRLRANRTGFRLAAPPNPPRPMTSQELAFLIHLVGDIHQPLHASNDGDRGGNCENLTTPLQHSDGSEPTTQLHWAWDFDEVLAVMKVLGNEDASATALFQRFQNGAQVQQLTPLDWAHQANDVAKEDIYQKLLIPNRIAPPDRCAPGITNVNVTQQYLDGNVPDVEQQLMRAGIRLSNLLNEVCAGTGCAARP